MGIGIKPSGIGFDKLAGFGIARSLRVLSTARNRATAGCVVCGSSIPRDSGHEVCVAGEYPRQEHLMYRYACKECFVPIRAANEEWNPSIREACWQEVFNRPAVQAMATTDEEVNRKIDEYIKTRGEQKLALKGHKLELACGHEVFYARPGAFHPAYLWCELCDKDTEVIAEEV